MTEVKKPIVAVLGLLAVLLAGLFLATSAGAYPAGVSASLAVTDTTPSCGQTVTVTGAHYQPSESVTISDGNESTTTTADTSGDISASLTVTCSSGILPESIRATGSLSGDTASISISAASGGSSSGGLSTTGFAAIGAGVVGVLLLAGGGLFVLAGKRRRVNA